MTRLVVTPEADADASEIITYLHREAGIRVAETYKARFEHMLSRLVEVPRMGAPRPVLGLDTRVVLVRPYLLIYDFTPDHNTLTLLRILHSRRNITPELLRR